MAPEYRASHLADYLNKHLEPWNAAYTKETGKLPPHPFQEPIDTDAMLEHIFAQYEAWDAEATPDRQLGAYIGCRIVSSGVALSLPQALPAAHTAPDVQTTAHDHAQRRSDDDL